MKKLVLLFLITAASAGRAQDLEVSVYDDVCIDRITLLFSDMSEQEIDLGCRGTYFFKGLGNYAAINVNGKVCRRDEITAVTVNNGQTAYTRPVGRITFKAKEGATIAR